MARRAQAPVHRQGGTTVPGARAGQAPARPRGIGALQALASLVGNRAMAASFGAAAEQYRSTAPEHQVVAVEDRQLEARADDVAARVETRLARTTSDAGGAGARVAANPHGVPRRVEAAIDAELGQGTLRSLELDRSAPARAEADGIGALAFAEGKRIAFGSGQADFARAKGARLLAHEAAHATLHPSRSETGRRLVHAKLGGTAAVIEQMSIAQMSEVDAHRPSWFRRLRQRGPRLQQTSWDKVLTSLRAYEREEASILKAAENKRAKRYETSRTKLASLLDRVEQDLQRWMQEKKYAKKANKHEKKVHNAYESHLETSDQPFEAKDSRPKAGRHQAAAMLLTRVRYEKSLLASGRWLSTPLLTEQTRLATGGGDGGQVNVVTSVSYRGAHASEVLHGRFKAESPARGQVLGHEYDVGLTHLDSNQGARAMAMYRLDQLLGAAVTARVEFAVHDGKLGTWMEEAKGFQPAKQPEKFAIGGGRALPPGQIDAADPVLQRCLNRLQILDAIAGQLDRHQENYFVQQDPTTGSVTGVTGIDLDMAFGKTMTDPTLRGQGSRAENYRGVPDVFDEELGRRILAIDESDVKEAIESLLTEEEVEATLARFRHVKDAVKDAEENHALVSHWDNQTFLDSMPDGPSKLFLNSAKTSYVQNIAGGALTTTLDAFGPAAQAAFDGSFGSLRNDAVRTALYKLLADKESRDSAALRQLLLQAVFDGRLPGQLVASATTIAITRFAKSDLASDLAEHEGPVSQKKRLELQDHLRDSILPAALEQAKKIPDLYRKPAIKPKPAPRPQRAWKKATPVLTG